MARVEGSGNNHQGSSSEVQLKGDPRFGTLSDVQSQLAWIEAELFAVNKSKRQRYFAACCLSYGEVRSANLDGHPKEECIVYASNKTPQFGDLLSDFSKHKVFYKEQMILPRLNIGHSGYVNLHRENVELKNELEYQSACQLSMIEANRNLVHRLQALDHK